MALAVVLGGIGAIVAWFMSAEGYLPGDAMLRSWEAAEDRKVEVGAGDDNWVVGDVAVRSRYDAVTGFGLTEGHEGKKLWEYVPAGRSEICGTAEHAGKGAVLVLQRGDGSDVAGRSGTGCTTVLALNAEDGRELWREEQKPPRDEDGKEVDVSAPTLDARGDLAVVAQDRRGTEYDAQGRPVKKDGKRGDAVLRGLDLRTGKPRWIAELPDRCGPESVSVGKKRVFVVLSCGAGGRDRREVSELTVARFDRATGSLEWHVPIDARRPLDPATRVSIESTDPLVLAVGESDENEEVTGLFVSFDENGRPRPAIDFSRGDDGLIDANSLMQTAVVGDRLYALAGYWSKGNHHTVIAFDLKTGEEVWAEEMGDPAAAMTASGDKVTVLCEWSTQSEAITTLIELDAGDGDETDERHFRDPVPSPVSAIYEHDGLLVTAGRGGGAPFIGYERW
ncbi:PQQ-binding-like beta-propeller repeat protein [Streptomyces viridiviolaceus]|uniref:PQQ-binding-like beta-propeller repeat protein n=1 Tax=Streptomyces viridiviolaceus TaxID=68282 RepID=A0ABW2DXG8_9ACTN|nr:PQQ-binding-like beta-propeller repeat protein [Streptomyces viridiviolaceus]